MRLCSRCSNEIVAGDRVSSYEGLAYHVGCLSVVLGEELEARVALLLKRTQEAVDRAEHGKHVRSRLYAQRRKLRLLLAAILRGRRAPPGEPPGPTLAG